MIRDAIKGHLEVEKELKKEAAQKSESCLNGYSVSSESAAISNTPCAKLMERRKAEDRTKCVRD